MASRKRTAEPLDRDIVEVLQTWPSVWTEVDEDRNSDLREVAFAHLVSAGLLQARQTYVATFQPPTASENSDATKERWQFIIDVSGDDWSTRIRGIMPQICPPHWFDGTTFRGFFDLHLVAVKARLSEHGESAKHNLESEDNFRVADFVLRRGTYTNRLKTNCSVHVVSSTRLTEPLEPASPTTEQIAAAIPPQPTNEASADDKPAEPEHVFRPDGDGYDITFHESGHVSAVRCKGLHQIHRLLQTPMVPVLMTELEGASFDDPHSRQGIADQAALKDVATKLREAKSELERATALPDRDTIDVEHCRQEVEKWEDELSKLLGLRGHVRDLNNPYDKKRPKIWGTINTAKQRLRDSGHSELADHLDGSIDSERAWFIYVPKLNPIPNWKSEKKDASLRP